MTNYISWRWLKARTISSNNALPQSMYIDLLPIPSEHAKSTHRKTLQEIQCNISVDKMPVKDINNSSVSQKTIFHLCILYDKRNHETKPNAGESQHSINRF
ncbi:uncharacterized protein LOC105429673 [Pogonomyrmex barbatus]|uniref:Uncharacterized protein LOC105429673 n=1 Tax=Pogonomyrmex barbatus TaxID=144034 RepID=A0A8N1S799_9HYME|nr:uncharacterized protein LOC105429673 [Pogonomyrmex barbatus]